MYRLNVLLMVAVVYFGLHSVSGYLYCQDNFCPGDSEADYVYTVKDEDGKTWYIEDGKPVSEEVYREAHRNIFEFMEEKDSNGRK